MSERKKYPLIDVAKFLCALLILFYHYFSEHPTGIWVIQEAISLYAVAVALFMGLSGFLLFDKLKTTPKEKQWSVVFGQAKRILIIYFIWSVPYLAYRISLWDFSKVNLGFLLNQLQDWIFNSTFYTIWFMPALAVGLVFAYLLISKLRFRYVLIIAAVFYALGSLQMTYSFVGDMIPNFNNFVHFSARWLQGPRGGIFFGMPLIVLGAAATKIKWRKAGISAGISVLCLALFVAEALILRTKIGGCGLDIAAFMIPLVLFLILFLTSVTFEASFKWMRSMSVLIFMSQRLFLTVIPGIFPALKGIVFANTYIGCVIVCGATILFSAGIIALSKKVKPLKYLY